MNHGFYNTTPVPSIVPGHDLMYLYRVDFPDGDYRSSPSLKEVAHKTMACGGSCNFDAMSGAFVEEGQLIVYAGNFFRERIDTGASVIRFTEF